MEMPLSEHLPSHAILYLQNFKINYKIHKFDPKKKLIGYLIKCYIRTFWYKYSNNQLKQQKLKKLISKRRNGK